MSKTRRYRGSLLPFAAGLVLILAGCSIVPTVPTASPDVQDLVPVSENGSVGVCHSVSMSLSTLDAVELGYEDGTLARPQFNYMVTAIAKNFVLLKIMHKDATILQIAHDLGIAIGDLATAVGEPALGDSSELGQKTSALASACDSIGASLNVAQ
jgi:hypothetical protein